MDKAIHTFATTGAITNVCTADHGELTLQNGVIELCRHNIPATFYKNRLITSNSM
jgi:hypothetical protein